MSIVEMKVPTIGESITEVTLSQWLKKDGEFVNVDEPICEFESDKATLEFPAEASGKLIYVASEGDDLPIGALVAKIDTSVTAGAAPSAPEAPATTTTSEAPPKETKPQAQPTATSDSYATGHPSPAAGKILREGEVNPADVQGTGKDGRITKEDAQKAVENKTSAPASTPTTPSNTTQNATTPIVPGSRNTRSEKMSRMRRTIAARLVSAKNSTAMLTTFNEVDLTEVIALRKKYQEKFVAKYGVKLGYMSIFAKACAKALMEMPDVNAQIDENNILYHDYVDISFAISTPTGLVVPPIHNVESLGYHEIEIKLKELAAKARNGELTLDEMKGGTFTITNGGIFGSLLSTPIINEPQSAILGMHDIKDRPMVVDGQIVVRPMMYLALSYDHRIIDGSTSVTFLVRVKELLEDPITLFMDL
ncbi:MAG: 2-oxoglutarate dehydrogenase complex dihydrolipoyllysine-residue succinyltransferase [Saprospiraceae bacterium]|nr:MAG: 2-oxoglutarate dehydrogenase E2 [Bacteroidetes bacterium OLB9]MCO6464931.1 2-oxoglutarate dehydrogenase complex dihydrolipoyllysine-residue succinyltransferase [Saprospiraceae bacterium]MCZ2337471.1 2-oxoglutarate dehydrogenase complex dihydrolipoyllysine-residue succinyltransferase [Chitinophagales bacterium]